MWEYYQDSGELDHNRALYSTGYAGHGDGKNNPDMQDVHDVGPLPCGIYRISDAYNHPKLGPITMNLTPDPSNEMFGRGDFRIHGDSVDDPGNASLGCMAQGHAARVGIADLASRGDRLLEVKRSR